MNNFGSIVLCFVLSYSKSEAHYLVVLMSAHFTAEDGHDAVYTTEGYYNAQFLISYNSTIGKFIGYTDEVQKFADLANKDQPFMENQKKILEDIKRAVPGLSKSLDTVKPQVRVFSTRAGGRHKPGFLVCSALSFYPKSISLTWLNNEKEVVSGVTVTEEMSNGDWLYQKHSYLEYTPSAGEHISCMVEHASLPAPMIIKWEEKEAFSESQKNKLMVGSAGLLLGLVFITFGAIYSNKPRGHVLVMQ
ncbi:unnamed protein product [Knipowitschia caucasica]|uniref:Ig-like domain-containing protein n=1 Tax=Knipowitschia caucasica TaxID=637954 RepID=A0AAV2MCP3_KNICA